MFIQTPPSGYICYRYSKKYQIIQSSIYLLILPISYILLKNLHVTPNVIIGVLALFKFIVLTVRIKLTSTLIAIPINKYITNVLVPSVQCLILSLILPLVITLSYPESLTRVCLTCSISLLSSTVIIYTYGLTYDEKQFIKNQIHKIVLKDEIISRVTPKVFNRKTYKET